MVVKVPVGLGKTKIALSVLSRLEDMNVEIYVPRHDLAGELKEELGSLNSNLNVIVIAGRGRDGDDGKPLCRKADIMEAVVECGEPVYSTLCRKDGDEGPMQCEFYDSCSWILSFKTKRTNQSEFFRMRTYDRRATETSYPSRTLDIFSK